MNALKNKRDQSRAYREAQGFMVELLELMSLAYALELHEKHGFGAGRADKLSASVIELVHACIGRYDGDCTLTALKMKCKDFGFVSRVSLGEKGEVVWKQ